VLSVGALCGVVIAVVAALTSRSDKLNVAHG
jgi:hypothetical protein